MPNAYRLWCESEREREMRNKSSSVRAASRAETNAKAPSPENNAFYCLFFGSTWIVGFYNVCFTSFSYWNCAANVVCEAQIRKIQKKFRRVPKRLGISRVSRPLIKAHNKRQPVALRTSTAYWRFVESFARELYPLCAFYYHRRRRRARSLSFYDLLLWPFSPLCLIVPVRQGSASMCQKRKTKTRGINCQGTKVNFSHIYFPTKTMLSFKLRFMMGWRISSNHLELLPQLASWANFFFRWFK